MGVKRKDIQRGIEGRKKWRNESGMVVHACNPRALQVEAGGSGICCIVNYGSPFTIKKKSAEVTLIPKFEDCLPYENIEPRTRWYRPYSYVLGEFPTDYSDESRVRFICGIGAWILFKCAALYSPRAAQQTHRLSGLNNVSCQ